MKEFTRSEGETWAEKKLGNVQRHGEGLTTMREFWNYTHKHGLKRILLLSPKEQKSRGGSGKQLVTVDRPNLKAPCGPQHGPHDVLQYHNSLLVSKTWRRHHQNRIFSFS